MERPTEARNPRAQKLSAMSTRQILELINDEDATVAAAVRAAMPQIERAVDLIVPALASGLDPVPKRLRQEAAPRSGSKK